MEQSEVRALLAEWSLGIIFQQKVIDQNTHNGPFQPIATSIATSTKAQVFMKKIHEVITGRAQLIRTLLIRSSTEFKFSMKFLWIIFLSFHV